MPTQCLHRLAVRGAADRLLAFREDRTIWEEAPWKEFFGLRSIEGDPSLGWLAYRYDDDWKRVSPAVAGIAAAYPDLQFTHESCDEFGQEAVRARYQNGAQTFSMRVEPKTLDWLDDWGEWTDDEA